MQDLQGDGNDLGVSGVKGSLDGDDQLWDNWKHLGSTLVEHVEDSLNGKESVWVLLLSDSLEEDGEVVMVVKLLNFYFPVNFILGSMLNGNRQISPVVESSEFTGWNLSPPVGSSNWLLRSGLVLRFE